MNAPPEHRDHLVEALAPTTKSGPGCGCLSWALFAVLFLVLGGGAIGVWRPLIVLPVVFIVIGAALWTLFAALRNGRVRRGRYDPRNADWHPAALAQDGRREPAPASGTPFGAVAPAAGLGAGAPSDPAAGLGAGAPSDPAAAPPALPGDGLASPEPSGAPAAVGDVAGATPADLTAAPQAPEAPEAPASPWA